MKIALIGYGKMGKAIERTAKEAGHEIVLIVDEDNYDSVTDDDIKKAEVAIEFTGPKVAVENYKRLFKNNIPVVSGTTGWLDSWKEVTDYCKDNDGAFFYASNFSIGVNIFFHLNKWLANVMTSFKDYKVFVEETHHIHKLDAPSGTAITLAEGIMDKNPDYSDWKLDGKERNEGIIPITAKREGEIPGIHSVTYKSEIDEIQIYHSAFTRDGFAKGAVAAAEYLVGKKGVYNMDDLLKIGQ